MRAKLGILALITGCLLMAATSAVAQNSTTGAVKGIITDQGGAPVVGATVVFSGPALQGTQAQITDDSGSYIVANLPPGTYLMTVYYLDAQFARSNVLIQLGKTAQVNLPIDTNAGKGTTIRIEGRAPIIDQGSTKTGRTITPDYTQNIPTGRTFGAVLGAAAGSQDDFYGVSFGGSTSAENVYIVEGINTTDPAYGLQSSNLPNEFVQETELITGGYNAEYGRSTGGVVNVLTKSGSNEFHGSVFGYFTPGALVADELPTPREGSSIDRVDDLSYRWDIGAELGGPIVKDKLWFHVGINPSFSNFDVHRIINSQVDANGDESPDVDENDFPVLEEVSRRTLENPGRTMFFTAKLTGAVSQDHQGSVAFFGNPATTSDYVTLVGVQGSGQRERETGAYDVSGKWTSKFNDNKTQVDAVVGFHRNVDLQTPNSDKSGIRWDTVLPLTDFAQYEMEYGGLPQECVDDSANDRYPLIDNCPVQFYNIGGMVFRENEVTDRKSLVLSATQRVKAAGHHTFKAGVDAELQSYDHLSDFPGGETFRYQDGWTTDRYYTAALNNDGDSDCDRNEQDSDEDGFMDGDYDHDGIVDNDNDCVRQPNGLTANTRTRNIGAYVQDSWAILPNLTANAGLRWEQQTLFVADHLADVMVDGKPIDDVAFAISDMVAPRFGVIYDPTQEGRSKVIGHWGRFYESIPMDINARAFGGEIYNLNIYDDAACNLDANNPGSANVNPPSCDETAEGTRPVFLGSGTGALVTPGIKGQYLDELVIGGEYELFNDFKVGASYIRRNVGRVIEDISTDGGITYVIANPGEANSEAIEQQFVDGEITEQQREMLLAAVNFDAPTRLYNALQITAEKRFARDLMVQASYTLSKLEGNFPGLFSPETGQLDPNLTSMYDLPELMANRTGPLAADRPHIVKVDGYYALNLEEIGKFVFGTSVRASSGIPHNVLGAHPVYGFGETYILPRGDAERSPFTTRFDVHVAYGRKLSRTTMLEAFMDVFNLFNQQPEIDVDEHYTYNDVNPIVGGDKDDLRHLKVAGKNTPVEVNANFGNANDRQAPLSIRFGLRLTF